MRTVTTIITAVMTLMIITTKRRTRKMITTKVIIMISITINRIRYGISNNNIDDVDIY